MKSKLILFFTGVMAAGLVSGQTVSLSDTAITFRNAEGKILTTEEVREIAKQTFSLRQEMADGKKRVTILPAANNEMALRQTRLEDFRKDLVGSPLPAFRLKGLYYQVWDPSELKGRVLVMNCWFTTCGPCLREIPLLNELAADHRYKNVIFLAPAPEKQGQIKKFLKKHDFKYNIIPAAQKYLEQLQVENFPTHLLIDKNGIIREVFIGYADDIKVKLQAGIDTLLKEKW